MSDIQLSHQGFAGLLGVVYRQWRRVLDIRLQTYGLTDATWRPLIILARADEPLQQKTLAAQLFLDKSSMVRILRQLRSKALIDWVPDQGDRRAKAISLTPEGQRIARQILHVALDLEQEILAGMSAEETQITRKVLSALALKVLAINTS